MDIGWGDLFAGSILIIYGVVLILFPHSPIDRTAGLILSGIGMIYLKVSEKEVEE